jgi:hypothetical protein
MRITRIILIMCMFAPTTVTAALLPLLNPGFESGTVNWGQWGSGSYTADATTADARTGSQSLLVSVGSGGVGLRYQRVAATAGKRYTVSAWVKHSANGTGGALKIEFHDSGNTKLADLPLNFTATSAWTRYEHSAIAPASATQVTISCEAIAGSGILFDDTAIDESDVADDAVTYDVSDTSHEFMGFGAHIWGYGNTTEYPNLLDYRQQALEELNIKYVRIENVAETATLTDMQATRAITDALGIEWVYMAWIAPGFMDGSGMLNDIPGFATWWKDEVDYLYANGMPVEYIELMNEPDSWGAWSTGITYSDYNLLVKDLRPKLDTAGYSNVGIVGAGPAGMDVCDDYMNALDANGIAAMAAWSAHSWGSADAPETETRVRDNMTIPGDAVDATLPKFVTEYATHERNFHGVSSPPGDNYGGWNDSNVFPYYATANRIPFGVRTYANTLGLLNGGANSPFIWQLIDEPTETITGSKRKNWGGLDLWGNPKPVYGMLKTLYPKIPVGSMVITPPNQSGNATYTGACRNNNLIVIGIANEQDTSQNNTITLTNAPEDLAIAEALAFEPSDWGDPSIGEPDVGIEVSKTLTLNPLSATSYSIDTSPVRDSTLTIVLTVKPDLNADGIVDMLDITTLFSDWLQGGSAADIVPDDGDGTVNLLDFALFAKHWLN